MQQEAIPPLQVFVINLDSRPDRWLSIQKICRQCGVVAQRISAVRKSPGWQGCALSHAKCAQLAKQKGLPWVLVLEDDCTFGAADWQRFLGFLPFLWANRDKWEFFNGGITYVSNMELFDAAQRLMRANGYAAHFILYNDKAYDKISGWREEDGPCDVHFDKHMKSVTTYPLIARQIPSMSDIVGSSQDYSGFFSSTEEKMREFLGQLRLL
jgi:glycosyl transferase family 25